MVIPEGREPQPKKRGPDTGVLIVLAVCLGAIGLLSFGALTEPDPAAVDESSTTTSTTPGEIARPIDLDNFSVSLVTRGEPFQWRQVSTVEDAISANLVSHQGDLYLFTSESTIGIGNVANPEPGLVYTYRPDIGWEAIGVLPPGIPAHTIASTFRGLMGVAHGVNGQPAKLHTSPDGIEWDAVPLPAITDSPFATTWGQAPAANEATTIVGLTAEIDLTTVVADHFEQTFGVPPDLQYFWPSTEFDGQETNVVLYGPFGLKLWQFPASEIGLTETEMSLMNDGGYTSRVLAGAPGEDWKQSEPDIGWLDSIVTADDGSISIFGHPQSGDRVRWLSYDGVNWERDTSAFTPYSGVAWSGGLAGSYDAGNLVVNVDGFSWEPVLGDEFPAQLGWWSGYLAGGAGGIAAVIEGWDQTESRSGPPRPTLTLGDSTLTLDYGQGQIVIETPMTTATYDMYSRNGETFYDIDLVAGTISFGQPDTDVIHMTVLIDDLIELESGSSWNRPQGRLTALVHSRDAVDWSIHDVATELGEDVFIGDIALSDDEIVAVVRHGSDPIFGPVGLRSDLEIWTASLP